MYSDLSNWIQLYDRTVVTSETVVSCPFGLFKGEDWVKVTLLYSKNSSNLKYKQFCPCKETTLKY